MKMVYTSFVILMVLVILLSKDVGCAYKRVCYLTIDHYPLTTMKDSIFDEGSLLESYEEDLCTHINVMPVLANGFNRTLVIQNEKHVFMFEDIQKLRDINPNLKILVTAIDFGKKDMAEISSSQENRREFAKNAVAFMEKYKFDGLDLDWEFPVWSSMNYKERQNFALLLEELHHEFKKNTTKEYLLTAAVAGDFTIIGPSYEVPSLNKYLDYINLMTYAFNSWHWYWPFTGHNAPLFGSWNDYVYFNRITMAYASEYWANLGMSKEKIVVGIPTYTHTFRLLYGKYLHGVKAPARYEGMETNRAGVCRFLEQEGSSRKWDNDAKVPYAYNDTTWITYEDGESATLKAKWIRDNGYGGAMTYNLNNDDYEGYCSKGQPFPIHKILRNILN